MCVYVSSGTDFPEYPVEEVSKVQRVWTVWMERLVLVIRAWRECLVYPDDLVGQDLVVNSE